MAQPPVVQEGGHSRKASAANAPSSSAAPSSVVEVFVGGLAPDASERSLRSSVEAIGLHSYLVWARPMVVTDVKDNGEYQSGGGDTPMHPSADVDEGATGGATDGPEASRCAGRCSGVAYLGFSCSSAAGEACRRLKEVRNGNCQSFVR